MRSTLLASCLLGLTFVVGCDDAKKTEPAAEPAPTVAPATAEPGKGAMEGPKGRGDGRPGRDPRDPRHHRPDRRDPGSRPPARRRKRCPKS